MGVVDAVVIAAYFILIFIAASYVRNAKKTQDFALGKRQFPLIITFASLASTCIGPGFSVGLSGKVADGGLVWVLIFAFFSVQMVVTSIWLAPKLREFTGAYTLGDVMGQRYGQGAQVAVGLVSVLFCAGVVGAIGRVTGNMAHVLLGVDLNTAIIVNILVIVLYSAIGGIKAVVLIDVLQFIIMCLYPPLIIFLKLHTLPPGQAQSLGQFNAGGMSSLAFIGLAVSFLLGELLLPPYAQRALIAKDRTSAKGAFLLVGAFSLVWFFSVGSIGAMGRQMFPGVAADEVFFNMVQIGLPAGVKGLLMAAMLSIIASSQASFINSAAVSFTEDVVRPFGNVTETSRLRLDKIMSILVGVGGTVFAMYVPSIIDALLVVYSLWAPTMVAPLIVAILSRKVSPYAGLSGMVAGGVATVVWQWGLKEPLGLPALVPGVLCSAAATLLVGFLMSPNTGLKLFRPIPVAQTMGE